MSQTSVKSLTALEELVDQWAEAAVSCATVRRIEDPDGLVAAISGLAGPWAFGETEDKALDELESVLRDWAAIKLADGDDDIPPMKGINLLPPP